MERGGETASLSLETPFARVCRKIFEKPVRPLTPAQQRVVDEGLADVAANGWARHQRR